MKNNPMIFFLKFVNIITCKLSNKLILIFCGLISLLIIISTITTYENFSGNLRERFISSSKSMLKLYNQNFGYYISQIGELSLVFRKDSQLMDFLAFESDDYTRQFYMESRVSALFYSRRDIEEIAFYIPSKMEFYSISHSNPVVQIKSDIDLTGEYWYKQTIQGNNFCYIEPGVEKDEVEKISNENGTIFTFHRAIIDIETQKPIGIISLTMNYKETKNIFFDTNAENNEIFALLDYKNNLYFCNDTMFFSINKDNFFTKIDKRVSSGDLVIRNENRDYQVIYDFSQDSNWVMMKLIPISVMNQSIYSSRNTNISIGLIFILVSVPLIMLLSNAVTGPLRRLAKEMDKVGEGNFDVQIDVKGNDEISYLTGKFNIMVVKINELIKEKFQARISEKNARLKALEAQVNPHFLYNSLQAISTKALVNNMPDISNMIEALAGNFRYSIKGKDQVKLSEELVYVSNYVLLQKARFGDRLSITYEIDKDLLDKIIPKLAIQVLIENSVIHCLEKTMDIIFICIKAYRIDKNVIISVSDSGGGIPADKLAEIQRDLEDNRWLEQSSESIGLKNLNSRLKLLFEGNAALEISSIINQGTEVRIILAGDC